MARTSHAQVMALPDAAQTVNFDLLFPFVPGGSDAQSLTVRCKTTDLPGSKIEGIDIELHGVKKREAGRAMYDHTFQATFMEAVDYKTYQLFRRWRDTARSWKNNTGANSGGYKVNLELDVYDNQGNTVRTMKLVGAWPEEVAQISYNGAESQAVELQVTFSFDYLDDGESY